MYDALNKYSEFLSKGAVLSVDEDIEDIITSPSIWDTEKARLVSARIGQGQFRKELLAYWAVRSNQVQRPFHTPCVAHQAMGTFFEHRTPI